MQSAAKEGELFPTETPANEDALEQARQRAENAERELRAAKRTIQTLEQQDAAAASASTEANAAEPDAVDADVANRVASTEQSRSEQSKAEQFGAKQFGGQQSGAEQSDEPGDPIDALRQDSMMAHLFDSLEAGKDIGHYGRLVFVMIARHFLPDEMLLEWLTKDPDFAPEAANAMLRQVESRDYNPPRRERILAWQSEQEFPILPDPDDPDCGNVYRNLKFPPRIYEHIQEYQEEKAESAA